MMNEDMIRLIVLDPGHFHASLVQKEMIQGIDSTVYVYAPEGMEVDDYLKRIESYNSRENNPTSWDLRIYIGEDFLERMLNEKKGNMVVLAGNNLRKTEYIDACIQAGYHVYSDKPMAIEPRDFEMLKESFRKAEDNELLLYDIMTERFEITTILQKLFSEQENIFGELTGGDREKPAITKESVHHFYKVVSGKPIQRPAWFFDPSQQGQAIADVGTHLVDLVMWEAAPDGFSDYTRDIKIIESSKWSTDIDPVQFEKVTGLNEYPDFLADYIMRDTLKATANSSMDFTLNDIYARISVEWAFEAPEGAGDTHYSIMRGTLSDLVIQQGPEENFRPEFYIRANDESMAEQLEAKILLFMRQHLEGSYPGLALERIQNGVWKINVPGRYRVGHEAHFAQVTMKFMEYMKAGKVPDWEVDRMIAKYYTTTEAVSISE